MTQNHNYSSLGEYWPYSSTLVHILSTFFPLYFLLCYLLSSPSLHERRGTAFVVCVCVCVYCVGLWTPLGKYVALRPWGFKSLALPSHCCMCGKILTFLKSGSFLFIRKTLTTPLKPSTLQTTQHKASYFLILPPAQQSTIKIDTFFVAL